MNQVSVLRARSRPSSERAAPLKQSWRDFEDFHQTTSPAVESFTKQIFTLQQETPELDCFSSHLHFARSPYLGTPEFRTASTLLCYITAAMEEIRESVSKET